MVTEKNNIKSHPTPPIIAINVFPFNGVFGGQKKMFPGPSPLSRQKVVAWWISRRPVKGQGTGVPPPNIVVRGFLGIITYNL